MVDLPQPEWPMTQANSPSLDAEPQVLEDGELAPARRFGEAPGQALDADEGLAHGRPLLPLPACGERVGVRGGRLLRGLPLWPPLTLALPHGRVGRGDWLAT